MSARDGRPAEQLLRVVRSARRAAGRLGAGRRDSDLRAAAGRGEARRQERQRRDDPDAGRHGARCARSRWCIQNAGANVDATIAIDGRNRFARLEMPAADALGGPQRSRRRRRAAADHPQPDRRRRHDPDDRVQPRRHADDAARARAGSGIRRSCSSAGPARSTATRPSPASRSSRQLAGALAERGFMVLRYDKRGVGQSGGRIETVTLQDYADDVVAIVKWLAKRDDVDPRRIAVAGPQRGRRRWRCSRRAREKKIGSLVLIAATGIDRRGSGARAAAPSARPHEAAGSRAPAEDRPAAEGARRRHHRQGLGGRAAGGPAPGGHRLVPQPAAVRSRQDHAADQAADPDRPGRPRHAGAAASRRAAGGAGAQAEEAPSRRGGAPARREPSAGQGHDRRSAGVRAAAPSKQITPDAAPPAIAEWLRR